ncbi:MAG TPA: PAS domain S-box protein [Caulobacteraceae bacterium]|jgi:PAS domain S-box-containing protein
MAKSPGTSIIEGNADLPFRELAQSLATPCWISDEAGSILWVNDAWLRFTGRDVGHIQAEGLRPLHDPDVYGEVVQKWAEVRARGEADEMVFPLRGRDGALRPFRTRVAPLRDGNGRIVRWFGTNTDISVEIDAEDRLRNREEQWQEVFERAGDAIFITDPDGRLTEVNAAASTITGFRREDLIGRSVFELIVSDEHSDLTAARSQEQSIHDWRLRRGDGSFVDLEISSRRLSDGRRLGVARDVSLRRLAEAALGAEADAQRRRAVDAERHLTGFWEASRDLFAVVSARDGKPRLINGQAWRDTLGYEEAELLQTRLFDLVHPDDLERTRAMREQNLDSNYSGFENRYLAKDGASVWLSWNIVRVGELIYCSARDVTAERRQRDELDRAKERLARSQKLEAVGQITGGVAHDFNNLMMVVSGHEELLRARMADDTRALRSLEAIRTAANRGQELTRRLLAFSRRQRPNPTPVSLPPLLLELTPLLTSTLGPTVELSLDLPGDVRTIEVDAGELESALLNMAGNARDAMPNGGHFRVLARNLFLQGEDADALAGEFVELEISDSGFGIPEDILGRVTEPYFTTKAAGQGTGLGLSQVEGFAQQSGGRLRVESKLGEGVTIRLLLPTARAEPAPVPAPLIAAQDRSLRILLVEDNPEVADVTCGLLEQLGHRTTHVLSAREALRALGEAAEPLELVLSDIVMAGDMNGLGLARVLKRERPGLAVLLVSGYSRQVEAIGGEFPLLANLTSCTISGAP